MGAGSLLQRILLIAGLLTIAAGAWGLYATWQGHTELAQQTVQARADFVPSSWEPHTCPRESIPSLLRASPEDLLAEEGIGVWGLADPCTMLRDGWHTSVGLGAWFIAVLLGALTCLGFVLTPLRSRTWAPFGAAALMLALVAFAGRALAVLVVLSNRVLVTAMVFPLPNQAQPPTWWTLLRREPALLLSGAGVCVCVLLCIGCGIALARRAEP